MCGFTYGFLAFAWKCLLEFRRLEGNINICMSAILAFQTPRSYARRRILRFTDIFSNSLIAECFAFFLQIRRPHVSVSHMHRVCARTLLALPNWLPSSKANKNIEETRREPALSNDLRGISSAARQKDRYRRSCEEIAESSPRCKSFNCPFVSISA